MRISVRFKMRVDLLNLPGPGAAAGLNLLPQWRVGAILEAIAVRDAQSGQLWLDIAGHRHAARLASGDAAGPQDGERLQLRVLRNSPVLALETLASAHPAGSQPDAALIADALRRYVPRQESPALMLANLAWLAQGKDGAQSLPRAVLQAAAQLWQAVPGARALSDPAKLADAIERSGVFLEAALAGRHPPSASLSSDFKALMLVLHRSLQAHGAKASAAHADAGVHSPVPTARGPLTALPAAPATLAMIDEPVQQLNELSRQTDGALARLTTVQIANSAVAGAMLVDLPVRYEDRAAVLRLRIERDGSQRHAGGSDTWTIEAAIDLGAVGALHAKVILIGKRVAVQLRAESPNVVAQLARRAGELEALLRSSGLDIERVVCLHGMPAAEVAQSARLLDLRA